MSGRKNKTYRAVATMTSVLYENIIKTMSADKTLLYEKENLMSDQYDGMKIYEYMRATQAKYIIKGNKIHEYMRATQPVYEIRGNKIHMYMRASQPVYEIRGNKIHEYMKATQAVYEIRA